MNIKDLTDIAFKLIDLINFEWNIHLAISVAFIGWLMSLKNNPTTFLKTIAFIAFLTFVSFNIVTLLEYYSAYEAIIMELKASINPSIFNTSVLYEKIQNLTSYRYQRLVWGIHIPIDSLVLFCLWNDNLWTRIRNK